MPSKLNLHQLLAFACVSLFASGCSSETRQATLEAGPTGAQTQLDAERIDTWRGVEDARSPDQGGQAADAGAHGLDAFTRDADDPNNVGGRGSCIEGVECSLDCDEDADCAARCEEQVLPANRETTRAVIACSERNSCDDPPCIMRNCPQESDACYDAVGEREAPANDGGRPLDNSYRCADMIRCLNNCGPDSRCFNGCLDRVRAQSISLAVDLTRCMMNASCLNMECGYRYCPEESQRCLDDE